MNKIMSKVKAIADYTIIDNKTGEIISDNAMFIGKKPYLDKNWRKVFVGFLSDIVNDEEIAGKAIRLLLWIIENLKPNSLEIYMSERIVCEELNISRITYYRWVKILLEKEYIEKIDTNLYRLVPFTPSGSKTAVNGQMAEALKRTK